MRSIEKNVILRKLGFVSILVISHKIRLIYIDNVYKIIIKLTGKLSKHFFHNISY